MPAPSRPPALTSPLPRQRRRSAPLRCPALRSARRAARLGWGGAGRGREPGDGSREGSSRALRPAFLHLLPSPAPPPSPPRRRALSGSRPDREKEPRPLGECRPPPESRARGHREAQPPSLRWGATPRATGSSRAAGSAPCRAVPARRHPWEMAGVGRRAVTGCEGAGEAAGPAGRRCAPWGGGRRSPVPPAVAANFLGVREGSCCVPASPPPSPRCPRRRRPALPLSLPASLPAPASPAVVGQPRRGPGKRGGKGRRRPGARGDEDDTVTLGCPRHIGPWSPPPVLHPQIKVTPGWCSPAHPHPPPSPPPPTPAQPCVTDLPTVLRKKSC